jgi:uncharacterized RDD family membrane protein YckC
VSKRACLVYNLVGRKPQSKEASVSTPASPECVSCRRPLPPGLFCPYCGVFVLDPQGTVVMASRLSRLGAAIVNVLLQFLTLYIGWVIWWFIVAPRGQNPGKAVVGLRVIQTDGRAAKTGDMFVRGLVGIVLGLIPFYLDDIWLLWDKDAQTLHDKVVGTVVVTAQGSARIVSEGSLGAAPAGVTPPPAFGPPVTLPGAAASAPPAAKPSSGDEPVEALKRLKDLRERDLITEEEYQEKRKAILDQL